MDQIRLAQHADVDKYRRAREELGDPLEVARHSARQKRSRWAGRDMDAIRAALQTAGLVLIEPIEQVIQ